MVSRAVKRTKMGLCVCLPCRGGEAGVTLMGTWCKLGKQILNCPCQSMSSIVGEDQVVGVHALICETYMVQLPVLPRKICWC